MYYWSRWTSIPTAETRTDEARRARPSWQDSTSRPVAQRETRPVVVMTRRQTQPLSAPSAYQRTRLRERETSPGISLDVRRTTHAFSSATRTQTPSGRQHDATTQPTQSVVKAFRLK